VQTSRFKRALILPLGIAFFAGDERRSPHHALRATVRGEAAEPESISCVAVARVELYERHQAYSRLAATRHELAKDCRVKYTTAPKRSGLLT